MRLSLYKKRLVAKRHINSRLIVFVSLNVNRRMLIGPWLSNLSMRLLSSNVHERRHMRLSSCVNKMRRHVRLRSGLRSCDKRTFDLQLNVRRKHHDDSQETVYVSRRRSGGWRRLWQPERWGSTRL
jgi:hypothetical protein